MGSSTTGSSVTSSISKSSSQQPDRRQHARDTYTKPDSQCPQIARSWQNNWDNLITLFDYPPAIRKVFYTTNAIESPNSVLRKATKQRKRFPTDDTALTVAYLPIQQASKNWAMPIQNWQLALNRFIVEFGDRLDGHLSWSGQ